MNKLMLFSGIVAFIVVCIWTFLAVFWTITGWLMYLYPLQYGLTEELCFEPRFAGGFMLTLFGFDRLSFIWMFYTYALLTWKRQIKEALE